MPHSKWRIKKIGQASSTQDLACARAESGVEEGFTVVAKTQTKGRGRRGEYWYSPPGGLYMTSVIHPLRSPGLIPLMAAVAVADAIEEASNMKASLKWPNDILLNGRKVGGILTEAVWNGGSPRFILLGIGTNINNPPPEALPYATSLSSESGRSYDIDEFLTRLLVRLREGLEETDAEVLERWRVLSQIKGKPVEVMLDTGIVVNGTAVDVDEDGGLIVDVEGRVEKVL